MGIAVIDEHLELTNVVRAFLEHNDARGAARSGLDAEAEVLPAFWGEMAALGWLGLHLGEDVGGSGYGLPEVGIVVEQFGRFAAAGPFLPTVAVSAVIDVLGTPRQRSSFLPSLADGSSVAGLGLHTSLVADDKGAVSGEAGPVLGAGLADVLLLAVGDDLVVVDPGDAAVSVSPCPSLDRSRRVSRVRLASYAPRADDVIAGGRSRALQIAVALAAADAAGGAEACVEMAVEYAKIREAFGQPIGAFQAVKHHCVNMLAQSTMATSAAWDAVRAAGRAAGELSSSVASAVAFPAFWFCAQKNIQVHGGVGFTWDNDAHLYLRRALSLLTLFGHLEEDRARVFAAYASGQRAETAVVLPPEIEAIRPEVRAFRDRVVTLPESERRGAWIDSGYLVPTWPKPWGVDASPGDELVIEQELAGLPRYGAAGVSWIVKTLAMCATPGQQERWVRPALEGTLAICQMFSEPGGGSDLAALTTKADRVEGGWLVNGQKIWTSNAHQSDYGFAIVRTDPTMEKHAGLTSMMINIHHPGVEVRPLRQITGDRTFRSFDVGTRFCEVFFADVFVPDDDVIGPVNGGWAVARAVLGNERAQLGGDVTHISIDRLIDCILDRTADDSPIRLEAGAILAEHHALTISNLRQTHRLLATGVPGPEGSLAKVAGTELEQHLTEICVRALGPDSAAVDGDGVHWVHDYLDARKWTIGGGTSEIQRNIVGERVLRLPRERRR